MVGGWCKKWTCLHENKMDNQITNKLWIIKSFWNIYLQDNYHFKDLNIKKKGLIFRIRIKNASRCNSRPKNPKKRSPNWNKTQTWAWHPRGPIGTLGVPIGTWQVPIDPKAWLGPGTPWLRWSLSFSDF